MYIWEVVMRAPESFGGISILYRGHRKGSRGPPGGATSSEGPYGLYGEGNQPKWAGAQHPPRAHAPRVGGNPKGGRPLAWGASPPPLGRRPPLDLI